MGKILLTWELGGGLGHLMPMGMLADELVQRGHQVVAAVQQLHAVKSFFDDRVTFWQAPIQVTQSVARIAQPMCYAHLLHNVGFGDCDGLRRRVNAWDRILDYERPDLVVVEHSPTALLALRGSPIRQVACTTGFATPPDTQPLPVFRACEDSVVKSAEDQALKTCNDLLASRNCPQLDRLGELFAQVDEQILATIPELDHFPRCEQTEYVGVWWRDQGISPTWPDRTGPSVFAYLKPVPHIKAILNLLAETACPTVVFCPGLSKDIERELENTDSINFVTEPCSLNEVCANADLAISHGGLGTTTALLLGGMPLLLLPVSIEQFLTAKKVETLGAGLCAVGISEVRAKLAEAVSSPAYKAAAQRFRAKYASYKPMEVVELVCRKLESHLDDHPVSRE